MAGKPGRPKKVVTEQVDTESGDSAKISSTVQGDGFDRDLFQASAVIAGAMAAGQGGWAPVISKTAVKVAKELLESVKEG